MPVEGGLPQRRTWDGDAAVAGWTPDGRVLVRTRATPRCPTPNWWPSTAAAGARSFLWPRRRKAAYAPDGSTLFFTRYDRQPSQTKRYQGGTAENIWRYDAGSEAVPLTADWPGTSHDPDVLGRARLFPFRPRRRDERLLDGPQRARPEAAHAPPRLRCSVGVALRWPHCVSMRRRPLAARSQDRATTPSSTSRWFPTSISCATTG